MKNIELFKEDFEKLNKKYKGLPTLDEIHNEFEILGFIRENDSKIHFPLRFLRRHIFNSFNFLLGYCHDIIRPNQGSAFLMEEFKSFTEEEKDKVVTMIATIMTLMRKSTKYSIFHEEKEEAEFFTECFTKWKVLKKELKPILENNITFWENYSGKSI
jgi:hypothetical protein